MSNINDTSTVSLFVNGEQAEAAMDRLRNKAKDLDSQLQAALAAGDKKTANKLQRELDKINKELNRTESAAKGSKIVLDNLSNTSLHGLRNALRHLQKELSMTKPNTERWRGLANDIEKVKNRIAELNNELEGGKSLWARFKNWAEGTWPAIDLLARGYDNVVGSLRKYVDAYASMDQEMANVRKFTGMTAEQVEDLNEEFKKIDTRTPREDLNKLAQEAGRLGKSSKEDVLGFVRAADKINVALDDLGDGATLTLSKLTGIFGDEARYGTEQSLLKVGSVINELSQNCSASAPYLANFTERLGGVGAQAGMTIPQIMGFGAVLDSNAQRVEASATALSQIIVRMLQDPAKYAKVAGLDIENFTRLIREDTNSALILFLETLQSAGGMDKLSPMFKDMGENGARAIAALSTLATHIDQVKAQQVEANKAFEEGISIDKEFEVQNITVQAALDKAKKAANELRVELGKKLEPIMSHLLTTSSAIMRGILITINYLSKHKAAIASITAAVIAYTAVIKAEIAMKKIRSTIDTLHYSLLVMQSKATSTLTTITEGLRLVYFRLTGQTSKAIVAQKAFNAAMVTAPWGAVIAAISAALIAFKLFSDEVEEAAEQYEILESAQTNAAARYTEESLLLQQNIKRLREFSGTRQEEEALINTLNEKYGPILGTYSSLAEWLQTLTTRGNEYCASLQQQIIMEGRLEQARQLIAQAAQLRNQGDFDPATNGEALWDWFSTNLNELKYLPNGSAHYYSMSELSEKRVRQAAERAIARAQELEDRAAALASEGSVGLSGLSQEPFTPDPDSDPEPDKKPDRFAKEKAWRERMEAEARISYAKGETSHAEHTTRMAQIAEGYYQHLLDRDDVVGDERLKIQADYWESVNKLTESYVGLSDEIIKSRTDAENEEYANSVRIMRDAHLRRLQSESLTDEEISKAKEDYAEATEIAELKHLANLLMIYTKGSDQWLETQRRYQELQISSRERHHKKQAALEAKYAEIKKNVFGLNQNEKDAEFEKQFNALTAVYNQELEAVGDNEAEKLRIKEAYMAAELALRKEYNQEGADDSKSAYETAVGKSVEWLNGPGGKALTGTLSTLTSGMASIFSGVSSMMQAEVEAETARIEARYEREAELAQGNAYKVARAEKRKEEEIAKVKNEANRKMFAMQVIQAVAQTAQNALSAYGSAAAIPVVGHILAPIAAAMAIAAGVVQIDSIKKQQQASEAQGYSQGGFTKPGPVDEPAGIVHAGEWVASQKLLSSPVARPMIDALDYAQRTNTIGSLRAEDVSRSIRANDSLVRIAEGNGSAALLVAAMAQNSKAVGALVERLDEPFVTVNTVTGDKGIKKAQSDYDRLMNNVTPKSKRK